MHSFILKTRPFSFNSWDAIKKGNYTSNITAAVSNYCSGNYVHSRDPLYGIIYYFYQKELNLDADNISKPMWDSLKSILIQDDKMVKIRIAGLFNLATEDYNTLDITHSDFRIFSDLIDALDVEQHIIYVEVGLLKKFMFKFDLETV
jgi:hypothetical protein